MKSFDQIVEEMQNLANVLVPHTYPRANEYDDGVVSLLKKRTVFVDGYEVVLQFSRGEYQSYFIEGLEIVPVRCPFLPMYLVCKIAVKFLGGHCLRHSFSQRNGKKVYLWHVRVDKRGRPLPMYRKGTELCNYEDFAFAFSKK